MSDAANIVIGATGDVFVAPAGTDLPETIDQTLDTAFKAVGYLSEDGVTPTDSRTVEGVKVWQSFYDVRRFVTMKEYKLSFVMREWNGVTLPLAYGGGTVVESPSGSGSYRYDPPPPETIDERSMIVKWRDGEYNYAIVIERGNVSDDVETNIVRSGPSDLPITFTALGQDEGLPWYFLTDDPSFEL